MNQYKKLYNELVYKRTQEEVLKYSKAQTERHHIKPVSIYPQFKDDKSNIVILTIIEHILAHKYLMLWYKDEYGENSNQYYKMVTAYDMFFKTNKAQNHIPNLTVEEVVALKIEKSRIQSLRQTGKKFSESRLLNLRLACKNPIRNKKIGDSQIGHIPWNKNKTFENNSKVYESRRGRIKVNNGQIELCVFEDQIPNGFVKGCLITKKHYSPAGKIHVNNGVIQKFADPNNIPEGFIKGRLKIIS